MRRHISAELKKVALRLAVVRGYKYKKIRKITGISERTTQRVRALHRRTGDVVQRRTVNGRPRILNGFEISVGDLVLRHELILNYVGSFLKVVSNNSRI
jgi:transposase